MKLAIVPGASLALSLLAASLAAQKTRQVGERVEIYYDEHMLPHVFGESDEATLYGLGFHHMREFPVATLNMLWLYSGRMAEIAGESYLDEDSQVRLWELPAIAERHRGELREQGLVRLLRAYVRGVESGRAWWRGSGEPSASSRLEALLGGSLEVRVDRVPDYLNQAYSPFGEFDDTNVPVQIRSVLHRMFARDMPVTIDHVLRLGVAVNSFFIIHSNETGLTAAGGGTIDTMSDEPELLTDVDSALASNGWMISPSQTLAGFPLTLSDGHVGLNKIQLRPYIIQLWGPSYRAVGLTMPGYPGVYAGYNDHVSWLITAIAGDPVVHNTWGVTLEDSPDPADLRFQFDPGGSLEQVFLEQRVEALSYFDPLTGSVEAATSTHYYVPRHPSENPELGFDRYPVRSGPPLPGQELVFQQATFTVESSPWEYMLRMGRARNATSDVDAILDDVLFIVGEGLNLMVADTDGNFRYQYMSRVPIQGAGVPEAEYDEQAVLDGARLSWRWQGIHHVDELPRIGPVDVSGSAEAWISNNATPDRIAGARFPESELAEYPAYMLSSDSLTTWRQERADELLRNGPSPLSPSASEAIAFDRTDAWMHSMWLLFLRAASLAEMELSTDAQNLIAWVEEHRSHDEFDQPNPAYDFVAHEFSQVQVYATLMRSHYLDRLDELQEEDLLGGGPGLGAAQLTLGHDADHPLLADPGQLSLAAFGPNVDALVHGLETAAALWVEGTGAQGLRNQTLLAGLSPLLPDDPWSDPRYDSEIEPHWQDVVAGDRVTRWGHVNVLGLTPHLLLPPKRAVVEQGGNALDVLRGYVYSALIPNALQALSFGHLLLPFYQQDVEVRPLGGVRSSLFFTQHKRIFEDQRPRGHQESVYRWDSDGFLYFHPMSSGSQTLFAVELARSSDAAARPLARGRFLQAIGGTEITHPDLLGDGKLAYQRRFAPTEDFAEGRWNDLVTDRQLLGAPEVTLFHRPVRTIDRDVSLRPRGGGPFDTE